MNARDGLKLIDNLNRRAAQLKALLVVSACDYFISELSDSLRTDYLWACSDLADGIYADLRALDSVEVQE